ncbi:hypothetical protein LOTGIDRAFT_211795 [Lottia gigantea]|uniref:Renin receptor n=1 Tax=Lottia gigantea TaxID=225164 RepID=V4CR93_LOTGI|nr:hypothetical protein LOTGIDRAFT_211795 [Lottia gigantea]ESP05005.1 hypothetical protein LOTGIDRAFT_211795 [Lottia gigantea]
MADDKISLNMFQALIGVLALTVISCQELVVTHAPDYVSFHQQDSGKLESSDVPDIIASTLGLNTQSANGFKGISHNSLFKKPKANVLISIVTEKQASPINLKSLARFPLKNDLFGVSMENVMNSLQQTFLDQDPLMLDMIKDSNLFDMQTENQLFRKLPNSIRKVKDRLFDSDSILRKLTQGSLNMTLDSDATLMSELQMIDDIIKTLSKNEKSKKSKSPDLLSFTITGVNQVADKHGVQSDKVTDAKNMVTEFINHATGEFKKLYKDNVVVEVLTLNPGKGQVRKARSLLAVTTPSPEPKKSNLNLADDYDENFPAIFNMVLWLMIVLAIAVYVIVYGMWFMDPGRDSIIYRMTSQRLKKE